MKEETRLHVGLHFRGIKHVQLTRLENLIISDHRMAPKVVVLPIRAIWASQERVNDDFATTETSSGMLPIVIRKDDEFYMLDGHHRTMRVGEEGGQTVRVELYDFDRKPDLTPLLDYDFEKAERLKAEMDEIFRELTQFEEEETLSLGI